MAGERVIISRIMNDKFVLVLYKRMGIPNIMNVQIYINKIETLRNHLEATVNDVEGIVDYLGDCNGNNDFLFEHFKKWKYLIKFHFEDKQDNYIYVIRNLKDCILKELGIIKQNKERKLDDKYELKFIKHETKNTK